MQIKLANTNGAHDVLHVYVGYALAIEKQMWGPRGQSTGNSGASPCITYMRPAIDKPWALHLPKQ